MGGDRNGVAPDAFRGCGGADPVLTGLWRALEDGARRKPPVALGHWLGGHQSSLQIRCPVARRAARAPDCAPCRRDLRALL